MNDKIRDLEHQHALLTEAGRANREIYEELQPARRLIEAKLRMERIAQHERVAEEARAARRAAHTPACERVKWMRPAVLALVLVAIFVAMLLQAVGALRP
jgi:hypothetical protein